MNKRMTNEELKSELNKVKNTDVKARRNWSTWHKRNVIAMMNEAVDRGMTVTI